MLTVPIAAEAVSSGRTAKPDAFSRRRTAIIWRSRPNRNPRARTAVTVPVSASALKKFMNEVFGTKMEVPTNA